MECDNDAWAEKWAVSMNDLLETSIGKLGRILKDLLEEPSKTSEDGTDLLDVHNICYELACKVGGWHERKYPTIVPWLPEDRSQLKDMTLLYSKSPWSIVLSYPLPEEDQLKNYTEESLTKFIETPPIGGFVCAIYHRKLFRGLILGILSYNRLKVLNIDTHEVFIVPPTSIFHMPPEVCGMHALSMHCCMMEEDEVVEKLWSEDLEAILTRALEECMMKVEIVKTVCESPPKYLIDLVGTNSEGHTLNLTGWLHNTLIPDMKQNFPLLTSKEELLYFLKDESIDPFGVVQASSCSRNTSFLSCSLSKEQILSSLCSVPPPVEGLASTCANSTIVQSSNSTIAQSFTMDEDNQEKLLSSLSSLGKRPVFSANKLNCDGSWLLNCEFTCLKIKREGSSVNVDQPPFPQVHNRINLPKVGERANVVITHVLSPLSFYVVLEEKYSDVIGQKGTESYTTLINRMNHPFSAMKYKPLSKPPAIGQLVAFRSKFSSTWLRGVITQACCSSVTVLNPDLGQSETIPTNDLKTIAEEDTILPFQAVLTFLHNIRFAENSIDKAKDYFVKLISSKKLHIIVKSVDVKNCAMEVELFTSDEVSINKALVASSFCVQVCPSPSATS